MERRVELIAMSGYLRCPYGVDPHLSGLENESRRIAIMIGYRPDALILWIKGLDLTYDMCIIIFAVRVSRVEVEISEHNQ